MHDHGTTKNSLHHSLIINKILQCLDNLGITQGLIFLVQAKIPDTTFRLGMKLDVFIVF